MTSLPVRCIFCGGFGLTKEHVFPNWLKQLFPRSGADTHTFMEANWPGRPVSTRPQIRRHQREGHSGTRKVRVVCRSCNGTWMSALENRVKPTLTALIGGERIVLDDRIQTILARWVAKTSVTAEHISKDGFRISEADRRWIKDHDTPPSLWSVWLAPYSGIAWRDLRIGQYTGTLEIPQIGAQHANGDYVKATSFGAGHLLGLCVACHMPTPEPPALLAPVMQWMHQIWPLRNKPIEWPPLPVFSDSDADKVAFVLTQAIRVKEMVD